MFDDAVEKAKEKRKGLPLTLLGNGTYALETAPVTTLGAIIVAIVLSLFVGPIGGYVGAILFWLCLSGSIGMLRTVAPAKWEMRLLALGNLFILPAMVNMLFILLHIAYRVSDFQPGLDNLAKWGAIFSNWPILTVASMLLWGATVHARNIQRKRARKAKDINTGDEKQKVNPALMEEWEQRNEAAGAESVPGLMDEHPTSSSSQTETWKPK